MSPLSSKTLYLKQIYAEIIHSFMLSQPNFLSAELHIQFSHWNHQIRFIQIRNIYIHLSWVTPPTGSRLKNRTCIVPKKAYAGSSTQWLTEMHEMGSDESSLIPSSLWPQSHGQRAACSLLLGEGCCVPSPAEPGCVNIFPEHICPEKPWRFYSLWARKILQRPVTDFPMRTEGQILTPKCLSLPIPPH